MAAEHDGQRSVKADFQACLAIFVYFILSQVRCRSVQAQSLVPLLAAAGRFGLFKVGAWPPPRGPGLGLT